MDAYHSKHGTNAGMHWSVVSLIALGLTVVAFVQGSPVGVALGLEIALLSLPQFRRAIGGKYPLAEKLLVLASASSCATAGGAYSGHLWLVTWVSMNLALVFLVAIIVRRNLVERSTRATIAG
jgi:hypothetical protein